MSGRRRSKPNLGGGRSVNPEEVETGCCDDEDDFSLDLGPRRSFKPLSSRGSRGVRGARGGTGRGRSQALPRKHDEDEKRSRFRPEPVQLPLQKIHMTSANKLQVKELLRELQSQEYQTPNR